MDAKTIELPWPVSDIYERSKRDYAVIVGSEIRMIVGDLRAALKSLSERDAQLAALQTAEDHATGNETRLLKEVQEGSRLLRELYEYTDSESWGIAIAFDVKSYLSRNPSPSVPTKEAQDGHSV